MVLAARLKSLIATPPALLWWAYVAARLKLTPRRKPSTPNSVALVSWDFAPNASTGVHLPVSFARHAALAGWRVDVVCGPGPEHPTAAGRELVASVPSSVKIHRVSRRIASEQRPHLYRAWGPPTVDGGYQSALAMASVAIKALAGDPPAVVAASGPRFANFVAARMVADAFGARLLLQYRDEWTVNTPAFVAAGPFDRREEPRCLARADVISFVSEGKRDVYRAAFPQIDPRKLIVTPNGWEPHMQDQARDGTAHLPQDVFAISYTGRCHISLAPLLGLCRTLLEKHPVLKDKLRLVFVGDQLPANVKLMENFSSDFPGFLITMPAMPPAQAIEVQKESGALLLINDYMYDGVVPLKTFEYLCRSQPVLVFGKTGGAARIIADTQSGLCVSKDDAEGFEDAVLALMNGAQEWDGAARRNWRERHSRKTLVAEMLAAVTTARTDAAQKKTWTPALQAEAVGERP